MSVGNQVRQKLRADIVTKLKEYGSYADSPELPDYVMILVANQKTVSQMREDLMLFLGPNTDDFVKWIQDELGVIEKFASKVDKKKPDVKSSSSSIIAGSTRKGDTSDTGDKSVSPTSITKESKDKKKEDHSSSKKKVDGKEKKDKKKEKEGSKSKKEPQNKLEEESKSESEKGKTEVQMILKAEDEEGGQIDELLGQEFTPSQTSKSQRSEKQIGLSQKKEAPPKSAVVVKSSANKVTPKESPSPKGPTSKVGAVVKRSIEPEESYDPMKPAVGSVASKICVQRKPSIPREKQASNVLVLRAVQDTINQNAAVKAERKPATYEPEPIGDLPDYTPTPISKTKRDLKRILSDDTSAYEPVYEEMPIKRPLVEEEEPLHPYDLRHVLRSKRQKISFDLEEVDQQIGVSRFQEGDGVDDDFEMNDAIVLDEPVDEEFYEAVEENNEPEEKVEVEILAKDSPASEKINERCKFWPECKNGESCKYIHPTTPCINFPRCHFGERCIYVHPPCKFDARCAKQDCPFSHTARRNFPPMIIPVPVPVQAPIPCKYYPNCINPSCPYLHTKPCYYGSRCANPSCRFAHPPSISHNIPPPTKLKWKASGVA